MGIDTSAILAVGVNLDELVKYRREPQPSITKYNPDTGEPYEVKQPDRVFYLYDGKEYPSSWDISDDLPKGLEVIQSDHMTGDGVSIVGKILKEIDGYEMGSFKEFSITELIGEVQSVADLLKLTYKEVKVWLVYQVS